MRLQRLLVRAAAAPYYNTLLRDIGITAPQKVELNDLEKLPFLDREVIAQHGINAFLTVDKSSLFSVTTSGSTGTPSRFLRSKLEEAEISAGWRRVHAAFGCGTFDTLINIGTRPDRGGPVLLLRKLGILPRIEQLAASAPVGHVQERVRVLAPSILTGYAAAIEALAEHVLATGARIQPPRAVFCGAMEVTDHCLEVAEKAFHAPAVDVYATNEFGVIAWACPERHDLLHINDDAFVLEVVGPDDRPVPPGTQGELVVTSLGLTSMPLIRYRIGDIAARIPERCECGRGLGLMTRLQGRTAHSIRRADGALISGPFIARLFSHARAYEWVRRFQVREEPGRQLRVLLDARQPPSEAQHNALAQEMQLGVGPDFQIVLEIVDQIPIAPNGKLQFIVPLARS
jgi:phenylacetate-CoA ligase